MNTRIWLLVVTMLWVPLVQALDSRANVKKAVELIEAGDFGLARSYLEPAIIDPRLSPGERSRAYYLRGFSYVSQDLPVSARKDFMRALEFNPQNPGALFALARLHYYGQGTPKDQALAVSLFEEAAALDHDGAKFHLGFAYLHGEGVAKDVARAREILRENAEGGDALSMFQLGASYRAPVTDAPDAQQALQWYEAAVAAGAPAAYLSIAYMFANGELGAPDAAAALANFRRAAELEVPAAYLSLAHAYLAGAGVEVDFKLAREYFEKAASLGVVQSFVGLGHLYEAGLGVAEDRQRARELYQEGARRGDLNAQLRVTYLLLAEDNAQAREDALGWLRKAVAQDSAQAHNDYAWLLSTSKWDELRNGTLAISHAKQAVEKDANAAYLDTLAAAYAENGQFAEAIATQTRALELVGEDETALRAELEAHLQRYQRSEPWRE